MDHRQEAKWHHNNFTAGSITERILFRFSPRSSAHGIGTALSSTLSFPTHPIRFDLRVSAPFFRFDLSPLSFCLLQCFTDRIMIMVVEYPSVAPLRRPFSFSWGGFLFCSSFFLCVCVCVCSFLRLARFHGWMMLMLMI